VIGIEALVQLYDSAAAHQLYDEVVTELEHALQCAALAVRDGADDALVAAALLHDVGHLILDDNTPIDVELSVDHRHEAAGARHLAQFFPPSVTAPVALHVTAKRYLCGVEPDYLSTLSPSSVRSLAVQGGPMTSEEAAAFAARPGCAEAIAIRRWDDAGKVDGLDVGTFESHVPLLRRLAVT